MARIYNLDRAFYPKKQTFPIFIHPIKNLTREQNIHELRYTKDSQAGTMDIFKLSEKGGSLPGTK